MAHNDRIFVGRPDAIGLDADGERIVDLEEALAQAARDATEITILGGYYDAKWLLGLLSNLPKRRRHGCRVRIAVGSDATVTLPRVWEDMRRVRADLEKIGYRDMQICIVGRSPVHFHTKLFRFLRTTRPFWFVGSANPGSLRHELMLRIAGRHAGLSSYVEAVFDAAQSVEGPAPSRRRPATLRDFFLDGMLCHKPPQQQLFTFNAFRLSPEDRRRIDARIGEASGVAHASPTTEGFGFGLRSALGMTADNLRDNRQARMRFRSYGMDTLFGLWMPRAFAMMAESSVIDRQRCNERRLASIGERLAGAGAQARVTAAFHAYLASMDRYLGELGIEAKPVRDRDAAFARFLASRTRGLGDPAFIARHARVMTFARMFDVWQDPGAAEEFERSFFEDLAWRAAAGAARYPTIVRCMLNGLGDDATWQTAEGLQDAFESRLEAAPWGKNEWRL